ncbi:hypothetical protein MA16_Dca007913 [Dendrobium catenatum]|uniref:Uncharacterized protein n=1 Tax=Dendrobium catenatum TaxID=906689 RepID=A0A2I0XJ88_9ASPA|nr:hypothetical protein MA16_Dca007913 [Dendrobium catenatum]
MEGRRSNNGQWTGLNLALVGGWAKVRQQLVVGLKSDYYWWQGENLVKVQRGSVPTLDREPRKIRIRAKLSSHTEAGRHVLPPIHQRFLLRIRLHLRGSGHVSSSMHSLVLFSCLYAVFLLIASSGPLLLLVEILSQKRFPDAGKDRRAYLPPDGGRGEAGRSSSAAFKSFEIQKKDRGLVFDLKEQQLVKIIVFMTAAL